MSKTFLISGSMFGSTCFEVEAESLEEAQKKVDYMSTQALVDATDFDCAWQLDEIEEEEGASQ